MLKNPVGVLPGGRTVTLAEYLTMPTYPLHDVGCPKCGNQLQLLGVRSQYRGFPRWEHLPQEGRKCDLRSRDR